MSGLYSTLNVAVRGMNSQQTAIDVTSHNIANANTDGYSRQRALMETTTPFGMPSMNNAVGPGQLGTGVQVSSITRIRDTYLDYQVRTENGTMGLYQGREKFLTEVESIFNEVSETGVSNMLSEVFKSWSALSTSPESSNTRTVVAQKSKALTDQLNSTYNQLSKLKVNCQDVIQKDVVDINGMLDQINDLNQQVISVKIGGNEPNDLMDKRDLLVDQLSSKFGITIDKKTLGGEDLKATDNVGGADPTKDLYLVKSDPTKDVSRFSYVSTIVPSKGSTQKQGETGSYDVTYYKNGDTSTDANKVTMTISLTATDYTSLDQGRVILADKEGYAIDKTGIRLAGIDSNSNPIPKSGSTENIAATWSNIERFEPKTGELNGYKSVQTDIDTYISNLDNMAKAIAYSVNAVHSGNQADTAGELKFFVNSNTKGKEEEITAGNIAVNGDILKDVMKIKVGKGDTPKATDGSRALAISMLRDIKLNIQKIGPETTRDGLLSGYFSDDTTLGVKMVNSSSDGMTISGDFTDIINRLADQTQYAQKTVKNNTTLLAGLEQSRTSISGVSLDEEMANLIQFQHAYAANAKIISTVDELLDLIVNGLKK